MTQPQTELDFEFTPHGSAIDEAPVVILLHGRGADRHDLKGVAQVLPEGSVLVTPQAPHPGAAWGYGGGWAWYRYVAEDRVIADTLLDSLARLDHFIEALPDLLEDRLGITPGPVTLGGFSQGGTASLAYALTHPGKVHGVSVFSGFLVDAPESVIIQGPALDDTPVFWGHGTDDPAIPFSLGERGRTRLRVEGVDLTTFDYPMGHGISPSELNDWMNWMRSRALLHVDGVGL